MFIDADDLAPDTDLRCKVCIIGGGPAGMTVLHELSRQGVDVMLLESGGLREEKSTKNLAQGVNRGRPYFPLRTARGRYLGGTSNLWFSDIGLRSRPLDETDLERRPWIANSGWPFGRERLRLYYETANELCGLGSPDYELETSNDASPGERLPLDEDLVRTVFFRFAPTERFRRIVAEDSGLKNVRILLHANALSLENSSSASHVDSARVGTLTGKRFSVSASVSCSPPVA